MKILSQVPPIALSELVLTKEELIRTWSLLLTEEQTGRKPPHLQRDLLDGEADGLFRLFGRREGLWQSPWAAEVCPIPDMRVKFLTCVTRSICDV